LAITLRRARGRSTEADAPGSSTNAWTSAVAASGDLSLHDTSKHSARRWLVGEASLTFRAGL
jgi:hypothetical protein